MRWHGWEGLCTVGNGDGDEDVRRWPGCLDIVVERGALDPTVGRRETEVEGKGGGVDENEREDLVRVQ